MKPYYSEDGITIYHGDCREVLPELPRCDLLISDPPYPNNAGHFDDCVAAARAVVSDGRWRDALIFWSEIDRPTSPLPLVGVHIWHRTNVNGRPYEPIFHFSADGIKRRSEIIAHPAVFGGVGPGCWEYLGHPTQKPLDLMRRLLVKTEGPVCDPFCGTGTTLEASKSLSRRAVGIEINERYCEIAAKRLAQKVLPLETVERAV